MRFAPTVLQCSTMTHNAGAQLGPYRILAALGSGGMGEVYRALDARLNREVAVKVLPAALVQDPDRLRRFEQEARAVAALSHPNILAVFDVGTHEGQPYLVSELLEGQSLQERLELGPVSPRRAAEIALQVAQGLAAAHAGGIVHRDLKPGNVFVTRDEHVKILDFGLAKPATALAGAAGMTVSTPMTSPGTILGTVGYMAPEQVRGEQTDVRTDIFSFGVVLYEMLSGRAPFRRDSAPETLTAILREEPPELGTSVDGLPPALDRIVRRCLEKDPARRFQSASDLAFAIQGLSETSSVVRPEQPGPKRIRPWGTLAALALAAAAATAGYLAATSGGPADPLSFRQLTFSRGYLRTARFTPDGQSVVYGAMWAGRPMQVFTGRTDGVVALALEPTGADLLAVSSSAELAIALNRSFPAPWVPTGTLARIPLLGGAPRPILEGVTDADWAPDGASLAVARAGATTFRIEYPAGTVLYENDGYISYVRFSPDGHRIAFMDHPIFGDDRGTVKVIGLDGKVIAVSREWTSQQGLAWSPDGSEVWFTASKGEDASALWAVDMAGELRLLLPSFQRLKVQDVARDGRILVCTEDIVSDVLAGTVGGEVGPNLTSFKWSALRGLSEDGRWTVINEFNAGDYSAYKIYLRRTDGSPPTELAVGAIVGLAPDGSGVLAYLPSVPGSLRLVPTGMGELVELPGADLTYRDGIWFSDSRRALLNASAPGGGVRAWVQDIAGRSAPEPVTEVGTLGIATSPDGRSILTLKEGSHWEIVDLDGGPIIPVPGLEPAEQVAAWLDDGRGLLVYRSGAVSLTVERFDLETGSREPWIELAPPDPTGALAIRSVFFSRDGRHFAYEVRRLFADLFVVSGIR